MCSCGRAEVELGCDLCPFCRSDYEERAYYGEMEQRYYEEQQNEYEQSQARPE